MAKVKANQPKRRRVRLLPITVTMLSLLFIIKLNEVYIGSQRLRDVYAVRDATASEEKKDEKKDAKKDEKPAEADAKKEAKPGEGDKKPADVKKEEGEKAKEGEAKKEGEPKEGEVKKEEGHGEPKKEEAGHGDAKEEEGGHGGGKEKPVEEPKTFGTGKTTLKEIEAMKAKEAQQKYTKSEVDILENLSKRREEIESRDR